MDYNAPKKIFHKDCCHPVPIDMRRYLPLIGKDFSQKGIGGHQVCYNIGRIAMAQDVHI